MHRRRHAIAVASQRRKTFCDPRPADDLRECSLPRARSRRLRATHRRGQSRAAICRFYCEKWLWIRSRRRQSNDGRATAHRKARRSSARRRPGRFTRSCFRSRANSRSRSISFWRSRRKIVARRSPSAWRPRFHSRTRAQPTKPIPTTLIRTRANPATLGNRRRRCWCRRRRARRHFRLRRELELVERAKRLPERSELQTSIERRTVQRAHRGHRLDHWLHCRWSFGCWRRGLVFHRTETQRHQRRHCARAGRRVFARHVLIKNEVIRPLPKRRFRPGKTLRLMLRHT